MKLEDVQKEYGDTDWRGSFKDLQEAVYNLYYAGVWTCDREVDAHELWREIRDAAGLHPGFSPTKQWSGPFPEDEEWIGVDLDKTLAHYDTWKGPGHIGYPLENMKHRVSRWLDEGKNVAIFTARLTDSSQVDEFMETLVPWMEEHLGCVLPVTNVKDYNMVELWDDRAVQVIANTGIPVIGHLSS